MDAAIPAADRVVTASDNGPPEPTPYEAIRLHIEDLMDTAQGFLDGEPIETQAMADEVGKLLDAARDASKAANAQRVTEKKPHDDAAEFVQAKYRPLIHKCALVAETAKKALAPFLAAEQARIDAEAAEARRIADEQTQAARAALESAGTDLAAREHAEALLKDAGKADRAANRAGKGKAMAAGGARSVSMRSKWVPVISNRRAALAYYMQSQPEALADWLLDQAERDVASGARSIPGFTISETKEPV